MKSQADRHRTEKSFEEGEWVYLKLRPYRKLSAKASTHQKTSKRYNRSFQITKKVDTVAYQLHLPSDQRSILYCAYPY